MFHLTDELVYREDFAGLPAADLQHLAQDLRRAFHLLVLEWLAYMQHLKHGYPVSLFPGHPHQSLRSRRLADRALRFFSILGEIFRN